MAIWVDADACPRAVKEIVFRAAQRTRIETTLVANRSLHVPRSAFIRSLQVPAGFDVADHRILEMLSPGDLVVTADIPLAAEAVARGAHAIDPRGKAYDAENIADALASRNLLDQLRSEGMELGGPAPFGNSEKQAFAAALDRWLARRPS